MFARRGVLRGTIGIGILALRLALGERAPAAEDVGGSVTTQVEDARSIALNEEGAALYAARDYRRAVEKFIQAHAIDDDPNLLFNIASCYEKLGDADAALEKYRDFLNAPGADFEGRQRAEKAIEVLRHSATEAAPLNRVPEAPPQAPPVLQAPATVPASQPRSDAPQLLPWLAVGGGAVLGVTGTALYLLGAKDHAEVTDTPGYGDSSAVAPMKRAEADALVRSGNTKKWIGATTLALGGALVTTYLIIWLLDDERPGKGERAARLSVSPDGAGATVFWTESF